MASVTIKEIVASGTQNTVQGIIGSEENCGRTKSIGLILEPNVGRYNHACLSE